MRNQIVILAGGKGTRMGNPNIPKVLVMLNNKPLILYALEEIEKIGQLAKPVVVVGFGAGKVQGGRRGGEADRGRTLRPGHSRRHAGGARRVRRTHRGGARILLRRLIIPVVVLAAAGGAFVYLQRTEPAWWAK